MADREELSPFEQDLREAGIDVEPTGSGEPSVAPTPSSDATPESPFARDVRGLGSPPNPLTRELDEDGTLDEMSREFRRDRETEQLARQRAKLEHDQQEVDGVSAGSIGTMLRSFLLRPSEREAEVRARRNTRTPGEYGILTPEQQRQAAQAELEAAQYTAPMFRSLAEAVPQIPDQTGRPLSLRLTQSGLDIARGLVGAVATRQEQRLAMAQRMMRGEIQPPQMTELRALVETGAKSIADIFVTLPIQYAGIIAGYGIGARDADAPRVELFRVPGTDIPVTGPQWNENALYQFGQQVERTVKQAYPGDPARQFEFSHSLVQGLASTMAFGGQGVVAHLLGAGPRGQLALIALSGMAAQTPEEFERVTRAMQRGDATERDRIIGLLSTSALGATEAMPFAGTIGANARGWSARLAQGGAQAFEEMIQEGTQQSGQNLTRRYTYDPNQDPYEGVLESMTVALVAGLGGGAIFSGRPDDPPAANAISGKSYVVCGSRRRRLGGKR